MIKGLNSIDANSYFIRLTDKKNHYLHYVGENEDGDLKYEVKEGYSGACVWHKLHGELFIFQSRIPNLELVKVTNIIPNDGTLN